jgi:hypothetical protein
LPESGQKRRNSRAGTDIRDAVSRPWPIYRALLFDLSNQEFVWLGLDRNDAAHDLAVEFDVAARAGRWRRG